MYVVFFWNTTSPVTKVELEYFFNDQITGLMVDFSAPNKLHVNDFYRQLEIINAIQNKDSLFHELKEKHCKNTS